MNNKISMRQKYDLYGVETYYEKHSDGYVNMHEPQIKDLLIKNFNKFDFSSVLDLCCGGGEVTKVLLEKGVNDIEGVDPFTFDLYKKNTNKQCKNMSFKDILSGKLTKNYATIVCSFALHLIKEKDLFMFISELFRHTKTIIVIAPHKRPFLDRIEGVELKLSDYSLTNKGKKVYLRAYNLKILGDVK